MFIIAALSFTEIVESGSSRKTLTIFRFPQESVPLSMNLVVA